MDNFILSQNNGLSILVFRDEMMVIRRKSILLSCAISIMYTSGVVAAFISLLTIAFSGCHLTPFTVFTLLSIINLLRNSALRSIGEGSQFIYEAYVSFERIQKFLLLPDLQCLPFEKHSASGAKHSLQEKKGFRKVAVNISDGFSYFDDYMRKSCIMTKFVDSQDNQNGNYSLGISNLGLCQTTLKQKCQPSTERGLKLTNVTCKINGENKILVKSVKFEAKDKTFTVITGPVGSGKSTLLSIIAGEIPITEGTIDCYGTIAYVPQIPWVFSGTLRENILFGRPFHYEKYVRTINVCALEEDIKRFPDGDQVVIGERGDTLSGGQQTRVSLARAVYADCDIYLLDNPLTALDASVSDFIFKRCILEMLSDKVRFMVSHQDSHMQLADQVIVLRKGSLVASGTFLELKEKGVLTGIQETRHTSESKDIQEIFSLEDGIKTAEVKTSSPTNELIKRMKIADEDRETGNVSFRLYWEYLRAGAHPIALAGLLVMFLLCQGNTCWSSYKKDTIKPVLTETYLFIIRRFTWSQRDYAV